MLREPSNIFGKRRRGRVGDLITSQDGTDSLLVSIASTVAILITSTLAGFVFAKYSFPFKTLLFLLVLASAMVPFETYMLPLYLFMTQLDWVNTYQGLVAPCLVMSFGIFFMRQAIGSSIPDELLDAARIDGASEWGLYWRIVLPLSTGAIGFFRRQIIQGITLTGMK